VQRLEFRGFHRQPADNTLVLQATAVTGGLRKYSIALAGHKTSVSLEPAFWEALRAIAKSKGRPVNDVVGEIDRDRDGNLSSAIRLYVLAYYRGSLAPEEGEDEGR
jgi:predicted DNA-binding ribbon-helix-helix protein